MSVTAWARLGVVAFTLLLVALQPWGEPWWYTADSDGGYLANGLNLLLGNPTKHLDHPALPMQALLTLSLGADYLLHGKFQGMGLREYVDAGFADPDRIIWLAAFWGIAFLSAAVVVAYEVGHRMFGHWCWGAAAAGLYLALPGHLIFATMVRPENLLSGISLLATYLLWRGLERQSPARVLLAAGLIGYGISEKVHAIGLLPPLAVAGLGLWRCDWMADIAHSMRKTWFCHHGKLLAGAAAWLAALVALNTRRPSAVLDWKVFALIGALAGYLLASSWCFRRGVGGAGQRSAAEPAYGLSVGGAVRRGRRRRRSGAVGQKGADHGPEIILADGSRTVPPSQITYVRWACVLLHPAYGLTLLALGLGLLLPSMLLLDEVRPLIWQLVTLLSGGGVNTGMSVAGLLGGLGVLAGRLTSTALWAVLLLAGMGGVASLVYRNDEGAPARRAVARDLVWPVAALGMLVPALCRSSTSSASHYLAPALVLLIPWMVRALQMLTTQAVALGASGATWVMLGLVVGGPYLSATVQTWDNVARARKITAVSEAVLGDLGPDEAILMNYGAMNQEAAYYREMVDYACYVPVPPLRCFPDVPHGLDECRRQGRRAAYYIVAPGPGQLRLESGTDGRTLATNAWSERFIVESVASYPGTPLALEVYRIHEHGAR